MHYNGLTERRGKEDEGPGKTKDRKYIAGKWQTKYPGRRVKDHICYTGWKMKTIK